MTTQISSDVQRNHALDEEVDTALLALLAAPCLAIWPRRLADAIWVHPDEALGDLHAELTQLPFAKLRFHSVLCELPDDQSFTERTTLLAELARITRRRIITIGNHVPVNGEGCFVGDGAFGLQPNMVQQPVHPGQMLAVFDF